MKTTNKTEPYGVFTGYDINPEIVKHVENACQIFQHSLLDPSESYECEDADIVFFQECPVEVTNEISFKRFTEPAYTPVDSISSISSLSDEDHFHLNYGMADEHEHGYEGDEDEEAWRV